MEMFHILLWLIYPYTVVAILGMGLVWKFDAVKDQEESDQEEQELYWKTSFKIKSLVKLLWLLCSGTGIAVIIFYSISDEPRQLFYWFMSLARLDPDMNLIMNISILSRTHLLLLFTFILVFSFTHYVMYLLRPSTLFKKRFSKQNRHEKLEQG